MDSMDIDLDFEVPDVQDLPDAAEGDLDLNFVATASQTDDGQHHGAVTQPSEATVDTAPEEVRPNKIHVRGLDDLSNKDITAYSLAYFPVHEPQIEWIDDTSANLVFETPELASEAIQALTLVANGEAATFHPLQLRAAKPLESHPAAALHIRTAIATDRKRPRAHEASRFYMMHPELDPREQRRRNGSSSNGRRRTYGGRGSRQDRDDIDDSFTASMYDDTPEARMERARRGSNSSASSLGRRRGGRDSRQRDRDRDRSASPGREDRNGRRRRTPPPDYRRDDPNPFPRANLGKELFPAKSESNRNAATSLKKELFPKKNPTPTPTPKKELFPKKAGRSSSLREGNGIAHDDATDSTADLFSTRMSVPFVDGASDAPFPLHSDGLQPRRSAAGDGFAIKGAGGRNGARRADEDAGFSIRGAAAADLGFAIRGAAAEAQRTREATDKKVKELFPNRVENKGKELFIKGRASGSRTKADTFF